MSFKSLLATGLIIPALSLSAMSASAQGMEGGHAPGDREHHAPLAGEIVSIDNDSLVISVLGERPMAQRILEKIGIAAGDEVTVSIDEYTHIIEDTHSASLEALEIGETVFVGGRLGENGEINARFIADHIPHLAKGRIAGEVVSVDEQSQTILVERMDGEQYELTYGDETVFIEDHQEISVSDLEAGDIIRVKMKRKGSDESIGVPLTIIVAPEKPVTE